MSFTEQEKQIIQYGKQTGKTRKETIQAIANFREQQQQASNISEQEVENTIETQGERGLLERFGDISRGVVSGIQKDLGRTARGLGTIGQKALQQTAGRGVRAITGGDINKMGTPRFQPGSQQFQEDTEALQPEGAAEEAGSLISAIAQFALPLGAATRATQGMGVAKRALGQAGVTAPIAATREIGKEGEVGKGTALETGIAAGFPVAGSAIRTGLRGARRFSSEVSGALTGTSAETVEQAARSAAKGGEDLEQFTRALRGETTPEQIVNNVNRAINNVQIQRNQAFKQQINQLSDKSVNKGSLLNDFKKKLNDTGIKIKDGSLDFSESKLRTVPQAQRKIETAYNEVRNLPESATINQIDTTRQSLNSLRQTGDDPSANLANKLIDDASREVRKVGENVDGYGQMLDNFGETTQFLDELKKGVMAGDNKTVDQTFRRITTSLKTNNEQRRNLVRQLDEMTDGALLSDISGQQLSERLPRGIFRQIIGSLALGSMALPGAGAVSTASFPFLLFSSPRVTGEFVRSLGLAKNKTKIITDTVNNLREALNNAGLLTGTGVGVIGRSQETDD